MSRISLSSMAKKWLSTGARFIYIRVWDCKCIHDQVWIHSVLISYYYVSSWVKSWTERRLYLLSEVPSFLTQLPNMEANNAETWWTQSGPIFSLKSFRTGWPGQIWSYGLQLNICNVCKVHYSSYLCMCVCEYIWLNF